MLLQPALHPTVVPVRHIPQQQQNNAVHDTAAAQDTAETQKTQDIKIGHCCSLPQMRDSADDISERDCNNDTGNRDNDGADDKSVIHMPPLYVRLQYGVGNDTRPCMNQGGPGRGHCPAHQNDSLEGVSSLLYHVVTVNIHVKGILSDLFGDREQRTEVTVS